MFKSSLDDLLLDKKLLHKGLFGSYFHMLNEIMQPTIEGKRRVVIKEVVEKIEEANEITKTKRTSNIPCQFKS